MAQIRIDLPAKLVDGMDIKFQAPCDCSAVTGLIVYYPVEDGSIATKEFTFRDAHNNDLTGLSNLFAKDAYVKVIVDAKKGYAYLQNADANSFLNSAILGPYIHDGENLTGCGENGKFKATTSGTISTINVNGVACSVKCGEESSMDLIAGCWYTFILDGNTVNFNAGGAGGGGLNFAVVGNPQPVSPKENTIWIDTDEEITGYVFDTTQPEDAAEGMVWISTGVASATPFNALKKNKMIVNPLTAQQFTNGAWVDKVAKIYQGGNWADFWNGELYIRGDEFIPITGGWESYFDSTYYSKGNFTKKADRITLSGANMTFIIAKATKLIDLTHCNTIEVMLENVSHSVVHLSVVEEGKSFNANNYIADAKIEKTSMTEGTISLNVGTLSGKFQVGCSSAGAMSAAHSIDIVEVHLR
jgi:hypothetical protein